ncbi:MAG: cation diffusion facilitator family transporter [Alphaproteobacteria bacterium]|nr:cation diffusion facilitator family transporter [Alphaproteobacteria bacterium]
MIAIDTRDAATGAGLMRRAALASLGVSLFLVAIKTFAYFTSCSVSVLASLADSALDLFTSVLNLVAIRSALTPADAEHRFGHGKAEPLAGLAQGAFIAGSATFLIVQAGLRLFDPEPVEEEGTALLIMGISIALALGLVLYQRYVVNRTGSIAIGADRMHYLGDIATNAGVILALGLVWSLGWQAADPIIAIVVACVLIWSAWGVFRQSYDQLMDRELPDAEREKIIKIVLDHGEVRNMHDLRTRAAGVNAFIQFHVELDPNISLVRAHELCDEVERSLCAEFPHAEVIIHQDPAGYEMPPRLAVS